MNEAEQDTLDQRPVTAGERAGSQRTSHAPRSLTRSLVSVALVAVAAVSMSACTNTPPREGAADHPRKSRGTLLTTRPLTGGAALSSAATTKLITYTSRDAANRPIVVSGTVSLPTSPPPPGGWPVISWAHGTTGVADACAPSSDTTSGGAHEYLSLVDTTLDSWVARGYAVVQTDYEGLGTPGPHPYLNVRSAANTVTDIVRAARALDGRVGTDWIAMGHSQGGHAALSASAVRHGGRDVNLLGAVAIAPGGVGVSRTAHHVKTHPHGSGTALAFLPVLLLGAAAADPDVHPGRLLTEQAQPLLTAARTECLSELRRVATTVPSGQVFRPDADLGALTTYLGRQDPSGLKPRVPVMVAQGSDDAATAKAGTDALVRTLCRRSRRLTYEVYPGVDHRGSIAASRPDAERFVDTLFAGREPATTC